AKALAASRSSGGPPGETLTQIGTVVGTPAYMSPEQAASDPAIDHRSDIYAFGCLAFALLAGEPPFAGRTAHKMLAAHMTEAPPDIRGHRPDIPASLADLVMRTLEKDPESRPQSAAEVLRVLETVTTSGVASTASVLARTRTPARTIGIVAAAFAGVAVLGW